MELNFLQLKVGGEKKKETKKRKESKTGEKKKKSEKRKKKKNSSLSQSRNNLCRKISPTSDEVLSVKVKGKRMTLPKQKERRLNKAFDSFLLGYSSIKCSDSNPLLQFIHGSKTTTKKALINTTAL